MWSDEQFRTSRQIFKCLKLLGRFWIGNAWFWGVLKHFHFKTTQFQLETFSKIFVYLDFFNICVSFSSFLQLFKFFWIFLNIFEFFVNFLHFPIFIWNFSCFSVLKSYHLTPLTAPLTPPLNRSASKRMSRRQPNEQRVNSWQLLIHRNSFLFVFGGKLKIQI